MPSHFPSRIAVRLTQGASMWLLCLGVAFAALVTAAQVAQAVANSPYANALLRNNATAVGSLAMFESGGETTVYNGSCCYGVLQMNTTNIRAAGYTPTEFAALPLQGQVDAWARMQSQALASPVVAQLQAMGTFNGQPVDFAFLLACVQLGQGNCATMVASGSCAGFSDRNGTTICGMAARTRASIGGTPAPGSPAGTPAANGSSTWTPSVPAYSFGSIDDAYASGSGSDMSAVSSVIRAILVATLLLLSGLALIAHFGAFAEGNTPVFVFMRENKRVVMMAVLVMAVLV